MALLALLRLSHPRNEVKRGCKDLPKARMKMERQESNSKDVVVATGNGNRAVAQDQLSLLDCLQQLEKVRYCHDPSELFEFATHAMAGTLKPIQIRSEIIELLELVRKRRPKTVMEIGTANGGTLFLCSHVVAGDATLISLDLPGGYGAYPQWKEVLFKSLGRIEQSMHLLRADSHNPATLESVKSILNGRKLDFLFIDGDHHYEGVKQDFEMYAPLVAADGILALHDIVSVKPAAEWCEVDRFWQELKSGRPHREIVEDWQQNGGGIGIVGNI
jgi:cephalosporin hydroxylase